MALNGNGINCAGRRYGGCSASLHASPFHVQAVCASNLAKEAVCGVAYLEQILVTDGRLELIVNPVVRDGDIGIHGYMVNKVRDVLFLECGRYG